jgi:urease accessory protein
LRAVEVTTPLPGAALLQLMWLASPALPVGGFSYSDGIEAAAEAGLISDEASASAWLVDQLNLVLVRSDLPLLAAAISAWRGDRPTPDAITALNDWVIQTRETRETRAQTEQMGRSLTDWLRQRDANDARVALLAALKPAPSWPLAFALACARTTAAPGDALLAYAFGWAENQVQALIKTLPLGQSAGQRILATLADALPEAVARALATDPGQRRNFAPMQAILSARHEQQYSRLFRS